MIRESFVTLATNDEYCVGALVLGASLKQSETTKELTVLVTPGLSMHMRSLLSSNYDNVIDVQPTVAKCHNMPVADSRPELAETFTKIQVWSLIQFSKIVFLDADTLVLQNIDELFDRFELTAAPDPLWPDCFNAGVFVLKPSMDTYNGLLQMLFDIGSFDGREQGLLNTYFCNWLQNDISHRLPCTYNCICRISNDTSLEFYTSRSAWVQFGGSVRVVHFAGPIKPWHKTSAAKTCSQASFRKFLSTSTDRRSVCRVSSMLAYWWSLFLILIRPKFSPDMYLSHISLDSLRKYDHMQDPFNSYNHFNPSNNEDISKGNNNNNSNITTSTSIYQSPHEEYIHKMVGWNYSLISPIDNLQLPYHPEFHDTNWNYLHRRQQIDEDNRFVEHHQKFPEPELPQQLNLSLSGLIYTRDEQHTVKQNLSHESQHHDIPRCQQHQQETGQKLVSVNHHNHTNQEEQHQSHYVDQHNHLESNELKTVVNHNTTHQYECDIVENDADYKTEPPVYETRKDDIETTSDKLSTIASPVNSMKPKSVENPKSLSSYPVNCHKCYEKLLREQQRLVYPMKIRRLSSNNSPNVRQVLKKHRHHSLGIVHKPMLNSSHSIINDCKNLVRNSSLHETSKTKNKITGKTYLQNLSPNQATLLNNHKQAIEFNRQLSSQFRGLDLAYSNNKQVHSITHENKSHKINHQIFLGNQLNDRFATKRCHSAEDIIQLDDDVIGNINLYPTKERCSSLTYVIQQVNNPLKLDNITQQFKVKRRRKSGRFNRIRSSHSNIDQDNLSKTKTSLFNLLNTQYKSRSLNSINAVNIIDICVHQFYVLDAKIVFCTA
ncbi:Glycogenin-1 [Schistosoma japonicum]|nr:Glycogenin-1 [Schistosoma japonicum]